MGAAGVDRSRTVTGKIRADLCVIGAGSGGLSIAAGAVQMGASVILIEQSRMGGECLNTGCVPSKALLAAAARGDDFAAAYDHMRHVIATIEPHDSAERFRGLGAHVVFGKAQFVARRFLEVGDTSVTARRFIVATGSAPVIPSIPGLDSVPYFTNETLFDSAPEPRHLLVLGGGPVGVEMAQAYRRLGAEVTLVEGKRLLGRDDPELVAIVRAQLIEDGVTIHEETPVTAVAGGRRRCRAHLRVGRCERATLRLSLAGGGGEAAED